MTAQPLCLILPLPPLHHSHLLESPRLPWPACPLCGRHDISVIPNTHWMVQLPILAMALPSFLWKGFKKTKTLTYPSWTQNRILAEPRKGLMLIWFPTAIPSPLIFGPTSQFQSNTEKQEGSTNVKFTQVSWASRNYILMAGWAMHPDRLCLLLQACSKTWGTTWSYCRCWSQRTKYVGNTVLLALWLSRTSCYHSWQNRLHLKQLGQLLKYN